MREFEAIISRFWSKVDKTSGCWVWTASRSGNGYGQFRLDGHNRPAHRLAWELTHGAIPEGAFVLHECDNPPCVRPDHLFLGDQSLNMADMAGKGRHWRHEQDRCHLGHLLEQLRPGRRDCRQCRSLSSQRYYQRKKQRGVA